ncbi:MAG: hypothetical protein WAL75_10120 [Terracidiphilus sp.]
MRIRTQLRFLSIYSAGITAVFAATVYFGFVHTVHGAGNVATFDRIIVHRIDVVEPDGTPRLFLSDRAEFPGDFYHGHEVARASRKDSAGMLFINDEGTEDGGLIYGGTASKDGPSSFSHLSFDQYDQDQTIALDTGLSNGERTAGIALNDMPERPITPELIEESERIKSMPHGPARAAAWADFQKKYPAGTRRVSLGRTADGSVALTLNDEKGRKRLALSVDATGRPLIQLLDDQGRAQRTVSLDR